VTGRDLHPLDFIKKFHRFIFGFLLFQAFPSAITMSAVSSTFVAHQSVQSEERHFALVEAFAVAFAVAVAVAFAYQPRLAS
jgi:hypothetical protein